MTADFTVKAGKVRAFEVTASSAGVAVNLTGYVDLLLVCEPEAGGATITLPLSITTAASGIMGRTLTVTDFTTPGHYRCTVKGKDGSGRAIEYPDDGYLLIVVEESLS